MSIYNNLRRVNPLTYTIRAGCIDIILTLAIIRENLGCTLYVNKLIYMFSYFYHGQYPRIVSSFISFSLSPMYALHWRLDLDITLQIFHFNVHFSVVKQGTLHMSYGHIIFSIPKIRCFLAYYQELTRVFQLDWTTPLTKG